MSTSIFLTIHLKSCLHENLGFDTNGTPYVCTCMNVVYKESVPSCKCVSVNCEMKFSGDSGEELSLTSVRWVAWHRVYRMYVWVGGGELAKYMTNLQLLQLFLHFLGHSSHCLCSRKTLFCCLDPHVQWTEGKGYWCTLPWVAGLWVWHCQCFRTTVVYILENHVENDGRVLLQIGSALQGIRRLL